MKKIFLLLALLLSSSLFAEEFKGVWGCNFGMTTKEVKDVMFSKIGTTAEEFLNRIKEKHNLTFKKEIPPEECSDLYISLNQESFTYAGINVTDITFLFIDDKLVWIDLTISGDEETYKLAFERLTAKYELRHRYEDFYSTFDVFIETYYYPEFQDIKGHGDILIENTTLIHEFEKKYKNVMKQRLLNTDDF